MKLHSKIVFALRPHYSSAPVTRDKNKPDHQYLSRCRESRINIRLFRQFALDSDFDPTRLSRQCQSSAFDYLIATEMTVDKSEGLTFSKPVPASKKEPPAEQPLAVCEGTFNRCYQGRQTPPKENDRWRFMCGSRLATRKSVFRLTRFGPQPSLT